MVNSPEIDFSEKFTDLLGRGGGQIHDSRNDSYVYVKLPLETTPGYPNLSTDTKLGFPFGMHLNADAHLPRHDLIN